MNKAILIGNLGRDPEIGYGQGDGTAIAKLSVATSEKWKDKYPGEIKERTEWHRIPHNSPGSSFFAFVRNEDFSHLFLLITKQNATRLVFDVFELIDP